MNYLSIYYSEAPHNLRLVRCALFGLGFSAGASIAGGGIWSERFLMCVRFCEARRSATELPSNVGHCNSAWHRSRWYVLCRVASIPWCSRMTTDELFSDVSTPFQYWRYTHSVCTCFRCRASKPSPAVVTFWHYTKNNIIDGGVGGWGWGGWGGAGWGGVG